uniref:Nascent polypeptide-associated complex subunit alpha-like UBA domain-containing protein n=1 Tax=Paramoeba aestuarina TaxID=180227 RepID=A0A7S4KTZ1_9EUKA|eukprot:CAMPEP_0201508174 /NCGR_PEP_ID=MMETSP0161_2-20130828/1616_1 /ASSEMBLY_ACC=CAM_ASM_000251 /TAXON_ID=180227 /ORGANISM="Neoparamoeba aestuarina, Strain SoJaBio B1-5/56/2" /LENGTH=112 /DNA_ID=CAMNT_0047902747 /DNA_START=25 /DNA_END=363 /DNA_ORIENTATION=+
MTNDGGDEEERQQIAKGSKGEQDRGLQNLGGADNETEIDSASAQEAIAVLNQKYKEQQKEALKRKQALASVSVKKEEVELIMKEFDIPFEKADLSLRENGGDCVMAMTALLK